MNGILVSLDEVLRHFFQVTVPSAHKPELKGIDDLIQSNPDVSEVFIRPLSHCGTLMFHVKNNEV